MNENKVGPATGQTSACPGEFHPEFLVEHPETAF
jgi:hypothetical protein